MHLLSRSEERRVDVICYIDDFLDISCNPTKTIEGINIMFKLKDYKAEPPRIYLGEFLEQIETQGGTKFCSMLSD